MNEINLTLTAVANMRRRAKQVARTCEIGYLAALEHQAKDAGFTNWHAVTVVAKNGNGVTAIDTPIDPKLPKHFYGRANGERSDAELKRWWNKPFACTNEDGTLDVRCLDGGAWDRPTYYGTAKTVDEAIRIATQKLATWLEYEKEPICSFSDTSIQWVLFSQDPRKKPVVLAEFPRDKMNEANAWKDAWLAKQKNK